MPHQLDAAFSDAVFCAPDRHICVLSSGLNSCSVLQSGWEQSFKTSKTLRDPGDL
jgi:hypothetical protein